MLPMRITWPGAGVSVHSPPNTVSLPACPAAERMAGLDGATGKGGKRTTYIETHGDADHEQVEAEQAVVLGEAVGDEPGADEVDEVEVEAGVDEQEQDLLDAVPDLVDGHPLGRDLQPRRDPDDVDADVDEAQEARHRPAELPHAPLVLHQQRDPVDDDAADALDLHHPEAD